MSEFTRRLQHRFLGSNECRIRQIGLLSKRPRSCRLEACPLAVVFVATECAPYSKTGGLGDVLQALPVSLAGR